MDKMRMSARASSALLQGTTPGPWSAEFTADDRLYVTQSCAPHEDVACDLDARESDARLMAAAPDLAAAVIALEAEFDEARAEVERLREQRDAIDADREALAMGVWQAVHATGGMPPLDTPRDRAEVIAAVTALRDEMEHLRSCVALGVAAMDDVAARVWCAVHGTATAHPNAPRDAAPLAAEVFALRRERDHLRSACDKADAEVERLRAIIDGGASAGPSGGGDR